jgi:hypothetical protein
LVIVDWNTLLRAPGRGRSRSFNAENPDGVPGAAARAASPLGVGRKGSPCVTVPAGSSVVLADIAGPGTIRHLWLTVPDRTDAGPWVLRDLVLRISWDDASNRSVEVPLGDFFCNGFGARANVISAPIVVGSTGGMNCYFPMPFRSRARIELANEHPGDVPGVYYQVDCTLGDEIPADASYFHAQWRRTNGTGDLGQDHVILDGVEGAGHYVGTYIALTALQRYWWGEGEVKFYIDDDGDFPTQTSTGLEDYAGGAWAFQDELRTDPPPAPVTFSAPYCGYPYYSATDHTKASPFLTATPQSHGMYRWHLPDPVVFTERLRVTVQQIGAWDHGLFERSDDISTVAYWYQLGVNTRPQRLPGRAQRCPR